MKVFGLLTKKDLEVSKLDSSFPENNWKNVESILSDCKIKVYYKNENVKLISTENDLFVSHDNIFIEQNKCIIAASDTKIAELLALKKEKIIEEIESNISMIYVDKKNENVYLSSNRAGAGRIFYLNINNELYFSNDFSLLLSVKGELKIDHTGYLSYLKFGAVAEDTTLDMDIKSIPVGHYAKLNKEDLSLEYINFYKLHHLDPKIDESQENELLDQVEKNLLDIFNSISDPDEKIHIFISGGIDSSLAGFYFKKFQKNIIGHFCMFGDSDPELEYAKQVAEKLQIPLEIHKINDEDVISCIKDTAMNTTYPHTDYSNVALNFLLREIHDKYGKQAKIIECNGADDGFGYGGLDQISIWKKLYRYPSAILHLANNFMKIFDLWIGDGSFNKKLMAVNRAKEKSIYASHTMLSAGEMVYIEKPSVFNQKAVEYLEKYLKPMIDFNSPGYYEKMNMIQFFHINSRLWVAKGYTPAENLGLKIIFPFTWKKMINVQAKIPLSTKNRNGIVKWPLKKLLEKFMENDFIYRAKSGFAPPLLNWLEKEENLKYFSELIFNGQTIKYLNKKKILKIFIMLKKHKKISRYASTLIWSILFFEEWLIQHKIKIKS
ncbi:MAG: hypothetical protein JXR69_06120 [Candidatus Delongbacteria bacterium]|nr:hypothetical protein [Candidatus Delongbacteria bacterium]